MASAPILNKQRLLAKQQMPPEKYYDKYILKKDRA